MEIITLKEAKERKVQWYEVTVETSEELIKKSTICLKADLIPHVLIMGELYPSHQLFGKIVYVDERTDFIYDAIVWDLHTESYIYMINTEVNPDPYAISIKYERRD